MKIIIKTYLENGSKKLKRVKTLNNYEKDC